MPNAEIESESLVILGAFNPAIIQPSWLAHAGLISQYDSDNADVQSINSQVSIFTAKHMKFLTLAEKFQIDTVATELGEVVRDIGVGIFEILEHTPLTAFGVNHDAHFRVKTEKEWHDAGHKLVPKEIWNSVMDNPGTQSVVVMSGTPVSEGRFSIRVEPSDKFSPGVGLRIYSNFHCEIGRPAILPRIKEIWSDTQAKARENAKIIYNESLTK